MRNIAVQLSNVSKRYTLHHEKPTLIENILARRNSEKFWALKNIDLAIKKGERIGIIGPNGSGKTTLLKIISGITTPTTGTVETSGKLVSLIELEAGFHSDLTGEENITLNGLLMGMNKNEIRRRMKDIITFANIGSFIDSPFYTYSSGMALRLGFSIAVHVNPDILVLDENLAVGDQEFKKKSLRKIEQFFKEKKTVILVSQWFDFVEKYCTRVILLKKGKVVTRGTFSSAYRRYNSEP
ncbi:ABC transporter ATP-binding protein [Patescibacteria group bacterium]|nr:ABC transporter ATP-binding protein [Patescibacteria group bacterium]